MSTHLPATLNIPISKPQKDEDASLLDCYAVHRVQQLPKFQKITLPSFSHGQAVQEESPPIYPTTKHIIPYNLHLWEPCCENLKPQMRRTVVISDMDSTKDWQPYFQSGKTQ
jgi:hypothetical protein